MEVKFSDLMECHQLNSIYLCDRHRVLDQSTGDLCIGALYSQHLDAALTLCPMEVVQLTEAILPLSGNSFVILNNAAGFIGQKDCVNGPSSELSLPKGTMMQMLEPGYTLKLCDHVINADSLVHLKTDYHQCQWDWTAKILTITPDLAFLHEITSLQSTSRGLLSLTDVIQMLETKQNQKFIGRLSTATLESPVSSFSSSVSCSTAPPSITPASLKDSTISVLCFRISGNNSFQGSLPSFA